MRPRLAVLDMIGTTVEAGPEVAEAFLEAFERMGIPLSEEDVVGVRGRSKEEAVVALVEARVPADRGQGRIAREVYESFRSILLARYSEGSRAVAGARATLEGLGRRGVEVVLTTGLDRETADRIVQSLGWESLRIRGVLTGEDVERGRPAPDLIHAAMTLAGETDAAAVLVVGDTVSDLQAAHRAGVGWSVGVTSGAHSRAQLEQHPHSVLLRSVADLPGWLDEENVWG